MNNPKYDNDNNTNDATKSIKPPPKAMFELKSSLAEVMANRNKSVNNVSIKGKRDKLEKKNKGVDERAKKDLEQVENEKLTHQKVYEKLKEKGKVYWDHVKRGTQDDEERYLIDFEEKNWERIDRKNEDYDNNYDDSQSYSTDDDDRSYSSYEDDPTLDILYQDKMEEKLRIEQETWEKEEEERRKRIEKNEILKKVIKETKSEKDRTKILREARERKKRERMRQIEERRKVAETLKRKREEIEEENQQNKEDRKSKKLKLKHDKK